jgi:hypothetical protein
MFIISPLASALVVPVSTLKGGNPTKNDKATHREAVQRKTRKDSPHWRTDEFQVSDQDNGRGQEFDSLF